jgi:hypothetical protein
MAIVSHASGCYAMIGMVKQWVADCAKASRAEVHQYGLP